MMDFKVNLETKQETKLSFTLEENQNLSYQGDGTRRLLISSLPLLLGVHYIDYIIKTEQT